MNRRIFIGPVVLSAVLLFSVSGGAGRAQEATSSEAGVTEQVRVQSGDGLDVLVFGHAELSRTVSVQRDGSITYLPIGRLSVAGLTVEQLAERIAKGLEETYHMREPRVSVAIQTTVTSTPTVYVLGVVRAPGGLPVPSSRPLYVTQVVALSGGFDAGADLSRITVQHLGSKNRSHEVVDLSSLPTTGVSTNDIQLRDGDTIYVPRVLAPGAAPTGVAPGEVSVMGQVGAPGAVALDTAEPMTVLRVLARVGGLTRLADRDDVVLIRDTAGKRQRTVLDVDDMLEGDADDPTLRPGDILYVGERGW